MKYEAQLTNLKTLLPQAKTVLIALTPQAGVDELAAGLSLTLALENAGKNVSIVTESVIRVSHTNLFGVGKVQDKVPESTGGDLSIVVGGVASADGTVPSLEKLDWYTKGADLHLVFHALQGQKFEPTFITPKKEGGNYDLVFVIGAANLEALGSLYLTKRELFHSSHLVNIDTKQQNLQFGATNIVDPSASSVSEIVYQTLQSLVLPIDPDTSTNILSGIFTATSNLQGGNVGADTFEVVAAALRTGGKKPLAVAEATPKQNFDFTQFATPSTPQPTQPFYVPTSPQPVAEQPAQPPVSATSREYQPEVQPSPEEAPTGEQAQTSTPEADWLTPKIFKGSSIG